MNGLTTSSRRFGAALAFPGLITLCFGLVPLLASGREGVLSFLLVFALNFLVVIGALTALPFITLAFFGVSKPAPWLVVSLLTTLVWAIFAFGTLTGPRHVGPDQGSACIGWLVLGAPIAMTAAVALWVSLVHRRASRSEMV